MFIHNFPQPQNSQVTYSNIAFTKIVTNMLIIIIYKDIITFYFYFAIVFLRLDKLENAYDIRRYEYVICLFYIILKNTVCAKLCMPVFKIQ